ncbi:MAG: zurA [Bacillales bacterium]|nr:zurA [Bacillales bacterium]
MTSEIVKINNLSYRYEQNPVLNHLNFTLYKSDYLGIVGPNGSGKSTILKLILNLLTLQKGEIHLFGESIQRFNDWEKIGYVSQKAASFNSGFPATVEEVVISGLTKKVGMFKAFNDSHRKECIKALEKVGLSQFAKRNIGELSGGQQQRVFIARALINNPELLILDEPTVGIDEQHVKEFYELLNELNRKHAFTILLVTHDSDFITKNATRIIHMDKTITFDASATEFSKLKSKEMHQIYGCTDEGRKEN